mgnify:CR=1 FL=1
MSLPNLSALCQKATSTHETYSDFASAQGSVSQRTIDRTENSYADDATCPICLAPLRSVAQIDGRSYGREEGLEIEALTEDPICGHTYHRVCIEGWIESGGRTCALCRTEIDRSVLETVLDDKFLDAEEQGVTPEEYDRQQQAALNAFLERARRN